MISREYQTRVWEGVANALYVETDTVPSRQNWQIKFIAVTCDIADGSKNYQLFAVSPSGVKQAITQSINGSFGEATSHFQLAGLVNGASLVLGEGWKLRAERDAAASSSKMRIIVTYKEEFERWPAMYEPHREKRKERYGRLVPSILEKTVNIVQGTEPTGGHGGEGEGLP